MADFLVDLDPYTVWIAQVKARGATVVGNPLDGTYAIPRGAPLARYPIDVAQSLGLGDPDIVSHSGKFWYYAAPADVQEFFFANDMSTAPSQEAVKKGTEELEPEWFKRLSQTAQVVTVIAVAGGVMYGLNVLQSFVPRRRP